MKKLIILTLALAPLMIQNAIAMQETKSPLDVHSYKAKIEKQLQEIHDGDLRQTLALTQAVSDADADKVKMLLALGANPNVEYKYKSSFTGYAIPLIKAASSVGVHKPVWKNEEDYAKEQGCFIEIMKLLVEAGADVNKGDIYGITPLMLAAHHKAENDYSIAAIKILLNAGADISQRNTFGKTAAEMNHNENTRIKNLLEGGIEQEKETVSEEKVEIEKEAIEKAIEEEKAALLEKETEIKLREKLKAIRKRELELEKEKEAATTKETVLKCDKKENAGQLQKVSSFFSSLWDYKN